MIFEHVDEGTIGRENLPGELFNRPKSPPNTCFFKTHTQMRIAMERAMSACSAAAGNVRFSAHHRHCCTYPFAQLNWQVSAETECVHHDKK